MGCLSGRITWRKGVSVEARTKAEQFSEQDLEIREVDLEEIEHLEETFVPSCWGNRCSCG